MYIPFSFFDIEIEGDTGWFIHALYPILFSYDLRTDKCAFEAVMPVAWGNGYAAYGSVKKYKSKLVIAPRSIPWLLIYDLEDKSIDKIELDYECMSEKGTYNLFLSMYIVNDHVYLIPGRYPAVIKIDLQSKEVVYINQWYNEYTRKKGIYDSYFLPPSNHKGWVYMPDLNTNSYIKFSIQDDSYEIQKVADVTGIKAILCKDEELFLVLVNDQIVWNGTILPIENFSDSAIQFIACYEKKLFVIPLKGGYIKKYDLELCIWKDIVKLKNIYDNDVLIKFQKVDYNFWGCVQNGNRLYMSSVYDGTMLVFDMETENVRNVKMILSKSDKRAIFRRKYSDITYENRNVTLDRFLQDLPD